MSLRPKGPSEVDVCTPNIIIVNYYVKGFHYLVSMALVTGFEPVASGVTGRRPLLTELNEQK